MLNLYGISGNILLLLIMASAVCFLAQVITMVDSFNRYKSSIAQWIDCIVQVVICAHLLIQSLLISQVLANIRELYVANMGYLMLRYGIGIVSLILAVTTALLRKKFLPMSTFPAILLTLPVAEDLLGHAYFQIYILSLIFWFIRAVWLSVTYRRDMKNRISAFSVKQAMDSLHSGLLYYRKDGKIELINECMQNLMLALTGKVHKDGNLFRQLIMSGDSIAATVESLLDEHRVYRLHNGVAWMFSEYKLNISGKHYFQLAATDVTERLRITHELRAHKEELILRDKQISEMLQNIKAICREEEVARISSDIHDGMAQRLAMMLRVLRSKEEIDEMLFITYVEEMLGEWNNMQMISSPRDISAVISAYAEIGVTITLRGDIPKSPSCVAFFADFVREGAANAVRHGLATEIDVNCEEDDGLLRMSIKNSVLSPIDSITEGSGIRDLRRKLLKLGGTLTIITQPDFILTAEIRMYEQGGKTNDT